MSLYKDGNIYRTYEEQVDHLTEAHREQLTINDNIQKELMEIGTAANLGGYNLVRFSFEKVGTFYRFPRNQVLSPLYGDRGDYVEISNGNGEDIPAYGYFTDDNTVTLSFLGDYSINYTTFIMKNITKQREYSITATLEEFKGTALTDYDPNENKKQVFNVIKDLSYNQATQYVSFDLNDDGVYNFVFIGLNKQGLDGNMVYAISLDNHIEVLEKLKANDILIFAELNSFPPQFNECGAVVQYNGGDKELVTSYTYVGNIRGPQGERGLAGANGLNGASIFVSYDTSYISASSVYGTVDISLSIKPKVGDLVISGLTVTNDYGTVNVGDVFEINQVATNAFTATRPKFSIRGPQGERPTLYRHSISFNFTSTDGGTGYIVFQIYSYRDLPFLIGDIFMDYFGLKIVCNGNYNYTDSSGIKHICILTNISFHSFPNFYFSSIDISNGELERRDTALDTQNGYLDNVTIVRA